MGRASPALALALTIAMCLSGCAARSRAPQAVASATPAPMAHMQVRGAIQIAHDAAVKSCFVGKPGKKLLNGYSVTFAHDALIESAEVLVPQFKGDGTYGDPARLILNVVSGPGFPHGTTLEERPQAKLSVTISGGGKSGEARFESYHTLYGKNGDELGGAVSGTIVWTCSQIERGL